MIEVELKFEIEPGTWQQFQTRLEPLARHIKNVNNTDTYYDTASLDLLQQAVFVRVRNHMYLEFKFNERADAAHTQSTERVFPLKAGQQQMSELNNLFSRFLPQWQQANTIEESIHKNGLTELAHIENQRVQYAYEDLILSVDHVEKLGDFFEVETCCEEATETNQVVTRLQHFVSNLASPTLRPVRVGYVELWLRLYRPQVYLLGKYRGEDDPEQR
jgi:adenylate cyclase class IV